MTHLALAQEHAYNLSRSLMVPVVLFETEEDDDYGVMAADEFDGDEDTIIHEYNPWAAGKAAR